ncbi:hypothetical protein JOB18_015433 [Solea senegalensis]|uniref:Uncharacterized protein n=1 Tax=Solea senegalensis TaxID=28829 RepID=A0AAV6SQV3_SOLSE|nr:hypothetical protein JOB18_015433 [Solea senegalensis]
MGPCTHSHARTHTHTEEEEEEEVEICDRGVKEQSCCYSCTSELQTQENSSSSSSSCSHSHTHAQIHRDQHCAVCPSVCGLASRRLLRCCRS